LDEQVTALPAESAVAPEASGEVIKAEPTEQVDGEAKEGDAEGEQKPDAKPPKTPEQREIDRLRRAVDRKTRQLYEARSRIDLTQKPIAQDNRPSADDSEPLSLTKAQLRELVTAEAARLAPALKDQTAESDRRQGVIQSLTKTWGQERFNELASDLDEAFDGLRDRDGKPKPAAEAIFEADEPAKVIEYLADPDHIEEAEAIARMGPIQAGKAIAKLEARIAAAPAKPKPQASKAPAPLEPMRGQGAVSSAPDPSNTKAWIAWRNEQERKGL
jgi:hypothetical protein